MYRAEASRILVDKRGAVDPGSRCPAAVQLEICLLAVFDNILKDRLALVYIKLACMVMVSYHYAIRLSQRCLLIEKLCKVDSLCLVAEGMTRADYHLAANVGHFLYSP